MKRFTVTGSPELETVISRQLDAVLRDLLDALPGKRLDALVLGGGYGRGEGGAYRTEGGPDRPYNDYDLVLVHGERNATSLLPGVHTVEQTHRQATGLHVDVMPIHRARIPRLPPALTWYELGKGHRVLWGAATGLGALRRRTLRDVHPSEWGRLLMNRAAGLVFAQWVRRGQACSVAAGEPLDAFVTRQIEKAWLAVGDVWLAERGLYDHLVRNRLRRFLGRTTGSRPSWGLRYEQAVARKLSPGPALPPEQQARELAALRELYVPLLGRRAAAAFRPVVGLYATLRHVPRQSWFGARPWSYPRERIRKALVAELLDRPREAERLVGSPQSLVSLWSRYG